MKINVRKSTIKKRRQTGFLTRQRTAGGRKVNRRQRRMHGSF
ncbi:MAG: 50S ribosomal protein L34 [Planctomycetota bacterium]